MKGRVVKPISILTREGRTKVLTKRGKKQSFRFRERGDMNFLF